MRRSWSARNWKSPRLTPPLSISTASPNPPRRRTYTDSAKYCSHIGIIRAAAALRRCPVDVLRRVLDVAGFAVNAVGGVDLQTGTVAVVDELVNSGGTEALFGAGVGGQINA